MRHLSILRFFEWTVEGDKTEQDAAHQLAVLLWEHKTTAIQSPRNSIQHKTNLIKRWAREYRATGGLKGHSHGTHRKTESPLAREDVSKAALKALAKMSKPGPVPLREVLLNKIFPKFGIEYSKISENTCRNYMQEWGWIKGSYGQQWTPKNKRLLELGESESDEDNIASDETAILETQNIASQIISPAKAPSWKAPIPSPTTAIRSVPLTQPAIITEAAAAFDDLNDSASPTAIFGDSTMTTTDRNSELFFSQTQYPSQQTPMYAFQMQSNFQNTLQFQNQSQQEYIPQPVHRYVPKSLDGIVPDPPDMMGIRPAFNGEPIPTFAPHPSMMEAFSHGTTFPRQNVNNPQIRNYNYSSQIPYTQ